MHPPAIAPERSECLLRIIEAAAQVRRRYQYFLWTQADMQRLLPHKLAVCGVYERSRRDLVFEALHSVPVPAEALDLLRDPRHLVLHRLVTAWIDGRQEPLLVDLRDWGSAELVSPLLQAGLAQLLVHGVSRPARPAELETFFIFASPHAAHDEDAAGALGMLAPYLHATYLRVQAMESDIGAAPLSSVLLPRGGRVGGDGNTSITEREREILRWVREGFSNQQIATVLGISALTVKNHVQKVLRKLGAANRTQAVTKAMALNLLSADSGRLPMPTAAPGPSSAPAPTSGSASAATSAPTSAPLPPSVSAVTSPAQPSAPPLPGGRALAPSLPAPLAAPLTSLPPPAGPPSL